MRFPKKKVTARATALALGLGLVAMLVTALPASASTITSFSPTCGVATTAVTITGTGFQSTGDATAVRFNVTDQPTFMVASDTSITTTVPAGATPGRIYVDAPTGNSVSAANFVPSAFGLPTITSFLPISSAVGSSVVITGTHFACASSVLFNATAASSYIVNSDTSITATVPTGATTGALHVTTPGGTANSATSFTVVGAPTITSFTPTSGPVGTSVTIYGTNLLGVTSVKFNGVSATTVGTSTATSVTATVPTGATTGTIAVTTAGGTATSTGVYTVTTAPISRTVSFHSEKHSRVAGSVSSGTAACRSLMQVVIQKQKHGAWKWADTTSSRKNGSFKTYIPPSHGTFRAKVNQTTLVNGIVCAKSFSSTIHI